MFPRDDIEAEISFLPTEHGGRKTAVASGYRPQFYYRNDDFCAMHVYAEGRLVEPGETVTTRLTFLDPESRVGRISEGMPFLIREGNRTVAYGRVTRILNLEKSARRRAESTS